MSKSQRMKVSRGRGDVVPKLSHSKLMVTDVYRITTACPSLKRHVVIIQMRKSELFFLLADYAFCIASSE